MTSELRSGGLIRLLVRPSATLTWVIPAWATLCGAVASGGLTAVAPDGVRLLLTLLLVDVGWGAVWGALATTDWATPLRRWQNWHTGSSPPLLPYAKPDSPSDRLARWLSQLWSWGQAVLAPAAGAALGTAAAGLVLALVLGAALGPNLLTLSLGCLALMQLAVLLDRGRGRAHAGWDGLLRLGLPWLAGHLAFVPLSVPSVALAMSFSLAAAGAGSVNLRRGRALWVGGQLAAAGLFLPLHRPLAILFLALLLVPQLLPSAGPANPARATRQGWAWLAAGMLLAAWAL